MFGTYVRVLKVPGAARFSAAGFVGRFQMSMIGLGAVLLLQHERGSYAIAGAVSAIYALSMAVISPQVSRFIDALGQRKVVPLQLVVHVPAMVALIVLAMNPAAPNWLLFLMAFVTGAAQPNIGPLVRARWSSLLTGTGSLRTAFAWESLLDEVIFIAGPPLATVLALSLFPSAALVVATAVLSVGTVLFLAQRRTEPAPSGGHGHRRQRPAIALPGVAAVSLVYVMIGGIFGSFEVTTVAFSQQHGHAGVAGLLLAANSLGSLCGGLVFGALNLKASILRQFLFMLGVLAVVAAPLAFYRSIWLLAIGALVAGVAVAPVLISGMALIERIVPMSRLTESMSWPSAGLAVGLAVASPLAGIVVDGHSASVAYLISSGCALAAAATGLLLLGSLRRANIAATARIAAGRQVPARV